MCIHVFSSPKNDRKGTALGVVYDFFTNLFRGHYVFPLKLFDSPKSMQCSRMIGRRVAIMDMIWKNDCVSKN